MPQLSAFTLVEMIVVFMVISIALSLLLPVLKNAQEQAKRIQCMSNLRQIGACFAQYLQDNNEVYPILYDPAIPASPRPSARYWWDNISRYSNTPLISYGSRKRSTIWCCPADKMYAYTAGGLDGYGFSYGFNFKLGQYAAPSYNLVCHSQITRPADIILCADSGRTDYSQDAIDWTNSYPVSDRHLGGCNILFVDGHIDWQPKKDIEGNSGWFIPK